MSGNFEKRFHGSAGFTLMEVMITLAIIGVLTAVAIPSYLNWKPGYAFRGGLSKVRGDLNRAKLRAFEVGREVRFEICGDGVSYQIIDGDRAMNSTWTVPPNPGGAVSGCPMSGVEVAAFSGDDRSVIIKNLTQYPLVTIAPAGGSTVDFTPRGITTAGANFVFNVLYDGQQPYKGQSGSYQVSVAGRIQLQ